MDSAPPPSQRKALCVKRINLQELERTIKNKSLTAASGTAQALSSGRFNLRNLKANAASGWVIFHS